MNLWIKQTTKTYFLLTDALKKILITGIEYCFLQKKTIMAVLNKLKVEPPSGLTLLVDNTTCRETNLRSQNNSQILIQKGMVRDWARGKWIFH